MSRDHVSSGAGFNLSLPCWVSRPTAGQGDQGGHQQRSDVCPSTQRGTGYKGSVQPELAGGGDGESGPVVVRLSGADLPVVGGGWSVSI
jgi:hypothetical protein